MYTIIDKILLEFKKYFVREATFRWFVVMVVGMIMRKDKRGVTSIINALGLEIKCYEKLLHFFKSSAFDLISIKQGWTKIVQKTISLHEFKGSLLCIGDHIKVSKEGKKMPAVKKLHQESQNSGKSTYIFGHNHGIIGVLANAGKKIFCIPVSAQIHDGVNEIQNLRNSISGREHDDKTSMVTKMLQNAIDVSTSTKKSIIFIVDAFFATSNAFNKAFKHIDETTKEPLVHLIVRAKSNFVAYEEPEIKETKGRGRPQKRGKKVVLKDVFDSLKHLFIKTKVHVYGAQKQVEYLCLDLIWRPISRKARFILVKSGDEKFILMSSCLDFTPEEIIELYAYRFKIEVTFKDLKQIIGGFLYHFWTKSMPKLSRSVTETSLTGIVLNKHITRITKTLNAFEMFVNISCVVVGLLQIVSILSHQSVWEKFNAWLRTKSSSIPSVETTLAALQNELNLNFCKLGHLPTLKIINKFKKEPLYINDLDVS